MDSWPNDPGVSIAVHDSIRTTNKTHPVKLTVKGNIPSYATGVLYRTGPLGYKVDTSKGNTWTANHWFDGLSAVHRFQIDCLKDEPVQVTYRSRRIVDELLQRVKETGNLDSITFAAKRDPCKSFFKKVMTIFAQARTTPNIGVTLSVNMPGVSEIQSEKSPQANGHSSGIKTLHTKTDANVFRSINPETLEPEGVAHQSSLHPDLKGPLSAAHAKSDPETGDIYNFNLDFGAVCTYRIFCTLAYIYSILLSENYVILCVWNSHITKSGLSILWNKNFLEAIAPFDASQKAVWYVIDRRQGKGLLSKYESDAFFCFHTINAWEESLSTNPSKTDIICELSMYDNLELLHRYYYDNLLSSGKGHEKYVGKKREDTISSFARFSLPDIKSAEKGKMGQAELVYKADKMISADLPTINPAYLTRKHRYTYGVCDRLKSSFMDGIVKFDNQNQTSIIWEVEAHTPGEPIFVADPEGKDEDDGLLLSVVLDGIQGKSYLLCLNAKDLKEVGRAEMEGPMAFGFHGAHVPRKGKYGGDI
ncbi:hypothetical protein K469DRAFT_734422 [Zopfia rhizophila CBS 207.26]|uniref:Carotenoid oxygenase n=1 Tax=Zopfia rhizophila CBS 207.26 TaxID=1314779 RepID=A0A6A6EV23_9PEZI|nr:hypothetical protein K469DRAFT_734422 [Zopfia rhizophila CBS 207.26]